jgi:hypothetical protein
VTEIPVPTPGEGFGAKDDDKKSFLLAQYNEQLSLWLEQNKQALADAATAKALTATTGATALALTEGRVTTQMALTATRDDTQTKLDETRADTDRASEEAMLKTIHDTYVEVSKGALDRAMTRVNVVTASIGAVTAIYTSLLGFVYAGTAKDAKPFTPVAVVPMVFLGLGLFLVTVYAAMFKKTLGVGPLLPTGIGGQVAEMRLITFMRWSYAGVLERAWALHGGIVSLGVGVACLPLPFVKLAGWQQIAILVVGLLLVALAAIGTNHNVRGLSRIFDWLGKQPPDLQPPDPVFISSSPPLGSRNQAAGGASGEW